MLPPLTLHDPTRATGATPDRKPLVVLSYGMGVESHAILERWIHEPASRPFEDFSQLVVVTSQVGEEHKCDTIPNVEARALPLMREHGIRFVELARRGHLEEDGIVVLQDTRQPERLHPDGVYKLSDELLLSGTVPQFGGEHRCAMKFKAFVIEAWMAFEFRGAVDVPVVHVFGYNAEEVSRSRNSEEHIVRHNDERLIEAPRTPIVVFGFNSEEIGRIERAKQYDGPHRTGSYPLQEWGWDRAKCHAYILERCGIDWKKSHCAFCLSGDTEVITRDGVRFIRDLAGTTPELLVPTPNGHYKEGKHGGRRFQACGDWVPAPVRYFGVQTVMVIRLRRGRAEKIVRATPEHRWLLDSGAMTTSAGLKVGDRLAVCFRPLLSRSASPVRPSAIGISQGFTFGDGVRCENTRYPATVPFYGKKDRALLRYFSQCEIQTKRLNGNSVPVALDVPRYWKDVPPLRESRSFLYGWLSGYFAADGDVAKKGNQATLCSSSRKHLEFARDVCVHLGVETSPIRERRNANRFKNAKTLYSMGLSASDLPISFWQITEHRRRVKSRPAKVYGHKRWVVISTETAGEEPVYCATVETRGLFTLADNLVTGNCPFCAEAAKGLENAVARWHAAPEQTAHGLLVEFNSLCFNPRGHLFKGKALMDVVRTHDVKPALAAFQARLDSMDWGLYRVRRIYTKKGKAHRCVDRLEKGSRAEIAARFNSLAAADSALSVENARGIDYAYFQRRTADVYPTVEGFFVMAPLFVDSKVRGIVEKFNERWNRVVAGGALNDEAFDANQGQIELASDPVAA